MPTVKEKLLFASALSLAIASQSISAQPAIVPPMPLCTDASLYSSGTCITPLPEHCTDPSQYDSGKCIPPLIPAPRHDAPDKYNSPESCESCGTQTASITIDKYGRIASCRGRGCSLLRKECKTSYGNTNTKSNANSPKPQPASPVNQPQPNSTPQSNNKCYTLSSHGGPGTLTADWNFYCGENAYQICWDTAEAKNKSWGGQLGAPYHFCSERK